MKFENIKFNETTMPQGVQALVKFKDYELSIVKNDVSYGGKNGLYEIMVTKNDNQIELPGITEQGDSVKGFLNESEVEGIIKKMHLMSGADPEVA
jgi:ATP sulfurylase